MNVSYSKSWLIIDNKPIILHNLINISSTVKEIILITRNEEELKNFEKKLYLLKKDLKSILKKIKIISDDENISIPGPARGLLTAVKYCQTEIIWWIPSDHPFLKSTIFQKMETHLTTTNIVSIFSGRNQTEFHFEPQIFVTTKSILAEYSFLITNRITDIYRLIPDLTLIALSNIKERKSLIGVNTKKDYKLAKSYKKNQPENLTKSLKIERFCDQNDDLNSIKDAVDLKALFNNSQFFLLKRLIELQIIKSESLSLIELSRLDWKYWKKKNFLIAFHSGKDYLLIEKSNTKEKAEIHEFLERFLLDS
jgi:molybdopterin-guanine dinucleotide biosynthesis protein A